jgi:hypothetical protein
MEGLFLYGLGVVTGMAALPWVQRLADRARRTLAELELTDPPAPHAATDTSGDARESGRRVDLHILPCAFAPRR